MANVAFGTSQLAKPAPKGYRLFENIFTAVFLPAFTAFVLQLPLTAGVEKYIFATLGFATAIVKGVGMFIGNCQVYAAGDAGNSPAAVATPVPDPAKPAA